MLLAKMQLTAPAECIFIWNEPLAVLDCEPGRHFLCIGTVCPLTGFGEILPICKVL